MSFKLDNDNNYIKSVYDNDSNYRVNEIGNSDICYIFCSSNGLYYPNTYKEFDNKIIKSDRYEWENIAKSVLIQNKAGKIIFVRDVYKQYYVMGINNTINTIDKLCELCKNLTDGMRVITVGTSSGGYLASILGECLGGVCTYNFGGQWLLWNELENLNDDKITESYYWLYRNKDNEIYNKWFDLKDFVGNKTPILYFYSAMCEYDVNQAKIINNKSNVYCFAMKSESHGFSMLPGCYGSLLTCDIEKLKQLNEKCNGKIIPLRKMAYVLLDKKHALIEIWKDIVRCHKSLQMMFERE